MKSSLVGKELHGGTCKLIPRFSIAFSLQFDCLSFSSLDYLSSWQDQIDAALISPASLILRRFCHVGSKAHEAGLSRIAISRAFILALLHNNSGHLLVLLVSIDVYHLHFNLVRLTLK